MVSFPCSSASSATQGWLKRLVSNAPIGLGTFYVHCAGFGESPTRCRIAPSRWRGAGVVVAVGRDRPDWTRHFLRPLRWIWGVTDEMQDRSKLVAGLSGAFSRRLIEGLHYLEREGQKTEFTIPKSLQDNWGLNLRQR